jgi:hypothetical protein
MCYSLDASLKDARMDLTKVGEMLVSMWRERFITDKLKIPIKGWKFLLV